MNKISGRVWKFGDNINTDNMSPAQYMFSLKEVAKHCLEAVRAEFCREAKKGDIVLGGDNFGTGSSRETAARALKELGVGLVIAKSFARIFFRNCIDIGLPVMICPELYDVIDDGDIVSVELAAGKITNESKKITFNPRPIPHVMMTILQAGGLINYAIREKW
jgi:3-isopropylmalate/(R)-2-methylmalate dehydratase small subunit